MESWKRVWRAATEFISYAGLAALKEAIEGDDPELIHGSTTVPSPSMAVKDWPCEGACLLTYTGWKGDGLYTVGECEEYFARLCYEVDKKLGEPAGVRDLLNFWDRWDTGAQKMIHTGDVRARVLEEVLLELEKRNLDHT